MMKFIWRNLQNILPGKGSGRALLKVILKDNSSVVVFAVACHVFDRYKEKIESLIPWDLIIAPEYYDQ